MSSSGRKMGLVPLLIASAVVVAVGGVECPADTDIVKIRNDYGGEIDGTIQYTGGSGSPDEFGLILYDTESRKIHEIAITQLFHITKVTASVLIDGKTYTCVPIKYPDGGFARNFIVVDIEGICVIRVRPNRRNN